MMQKNLTCFRCKSEITLENNIDIFVTISQEIATHTLDEEQQAYVATEPSSKQESRRSAIVLCEDCFVKYVKVLQKLIQDDNGQIKRYTNIGQPFAYNENSVTPETLAGTTKLTKPFKISHNGRKSKDVQ
jgi:hypothetical protein